MFARWRRGPGPRALMALFAASASEAITDAQLSHLIETEPERLLHSKHLVHLLQVGLRRRLLPVSTPPGSFRGLNNKLAPKVPKRDWRRGATSNSLSRQTQHAFMYEFVDSHGPRLRARAKDEQRPLRCLDWDGWYGGSVFASVCEEIDVIEFATPFGQMPPRRLKWSVSGLRMATRWYHADAHSMSRYLGRGVYDLVIANSVFEHLHDPFTAMAEVHTVLRRGGYLFWHTPFQFEEHGVPHDYFRYSVSCARKLAERAGMAVELAAADGSYTAVLSNVLGLGAKFWPVAALQMDDNVTTLAHKEDKPRHYLSTKMLAVKP